MLALYRSGRQAVALAAFRTARSALLDELGLDPSPRLQALERAILSQDEALEVSSARRVAPSNVPAPPNALVGRERELKELVDLCRADDIRLVTLTGPGGVGKTRLAVAVAAASTESFDGRVYFVDLAPVRDPQLVLAALADPLEIRETGPRTLRDALVGHLRGVRVLLVVDNFEQVQAAATLVGDLLAAAPTLTVLVTSRTRLRLAGEQEYAVQPLPRDDALALFAARAHAVRATAKIDESPAVELCRRLDHLPLAIELAAARTRLLSPSALLERLDRRLEVLGEGPRDLPARQRTLRATLDWSYDLLGPAEQATFERLAVFVAGCSVKAAEAVTDASLESLEALVDGSLAVERGGRIEMLATMREYGLERLAARGELDEVRRRHATYLAELAAHADTQIDSSDQGRWFDELELEHDDLRAALAWAIDRPEPELALRIAADSGWFWFVRGHLTDGRRWLEASLALTAPSATEPRAKALMRLGALAEAQGDYPAAAGAYEGAVVLQSTLGDAQRLVAARTNLGNIAYYRREYERAAALYEESLEEARRADDELGIAALLCNLALVRVTQGRPEEGKELLDESLILARRLDDPYGVANVLQALGAALADLGQLDAAAAALRESLELFHTLDERTETAVTLEELAGVAAESEPEAATALLGAARAIRDAIHAAPTGPNDDRSARTLERIRACLSDAEVERALADGRATPPAALAEIVLARLEARSASSRA
jgi:predicted ATPase